MAPSANFLFVVGVALLALSALLWTGDNSAHVNLYTMAPGTVISTVLPSTMVPPSLRSHSAHPLSARLPVEVPMPMARSSSMALASGEGAATKGTIVVIGATGLSASEAVYQALARGYKVVGLARTPSKLVVPEGSGGADSGKPLVADNLEVVQGSVTVLADVKRAMMADDIVGVVVALGGKTKDVGATMLTDGTKNVIEAMKAKGVKRVSVVTSIGTGDSEEQAPFFFRVLMGTVMRGIFQDKNNQEALFLQGPGADLEYTIVRPGGLNVEPPTNIINVIDGEAGSIPRADVAKFCLDAITEPDWQYIGKTPCISSLAGTSWTKDRTAKARGA